VLRKHLDPALKSKGQATITGRRTRVCRARCSAASDAGAPFKALGWGKGHMGACRGFCCGVGVDHGRHEKLARLVRRPDHGAARHVTETHLLAEDSQLIEDLRRDVLDHRQVVLCRAQILAERQHIDVCCPQVGHGLHDLVPRLSEAEHD